MLLFIPDRTDRLWTGGSGQKKRIHCKTYAISRKVNEGSVNKWVKEGEREKVREGEREKVRKGERES